MTDKTFKIVGTSLFNGNWKVRWANDFVTRFKTLHKGGHTSIELFEEKLNQLFDRLNIN